MNVRMGEQQVLWYGHFHRWQQKGMMLTTMWYIMVGLLNLIICQLHYLVEPEGYCMVIGITFILLKYQQLCHYGMTRSTPLVLVWYVGVS